MGLNRQNYLINKLFFTLIALVFMNLTGSLVFFFIQLNISGFNISIFIWVVISVLSVLYSIFILYKPYTRLNSYIKSYNTGYNRDYVFTHSIYLSPEIEVFLKKIHSEIKTEETIKNSNKHAQYLALQNQINPHFLYNTLEGIRSDALSMGVPKIADIIESLGVYFRYTISKIDRLVTLDEEMANLKNYLVIQNYRFGEKIKMEEIYENCDRSIRQCLMPKLVLQPFIENSIIHGLENKIEKGTIKIIFSTTKDLLLITIEDDGIGIPDEEVIRINKNMKSVSMETKSGGIAISNVNNRIRLLLGDIFGIKLRSVSGHGTAVDITLPLKLQK